MSGWCRREEGREKEGGGGRGEGWCGLGSHHQRRLLLKQPPEFITNWHELQVILYLTTEKRRHINNKEEISYSAAATHKQTFDFVLLCLCGNCTKHSLEDYLKLNITTLTLNLTITLTLKLGVNSNSTLKEPKKETNVDGDWMQSGRMLVCVNVRHFVLPTFLPKRVLAL